MVPRGTSPAGEERGETDVFAGYIFIKMTSEQSRKIANLTRSFSQKFEISLSLYFFKMAQI